MLVSSDCDGAVCNKNSVAYERRAVYISYSLFCGPALCRLQADQFRFRFQIRVEATLCVLF